MDFDFDPVCATPISEEEIKYFEEEEAKCKMDISIRIRYIGLDTYMAVIYDNYSATNSYSETNLPLLTLKGDYPETLMRDIYKEWRKYRKENGKQK